MNTKENNGAGNEGKVKKYVVAPAWRQSYTRPFRPVRDGWHVLVETEFGTEWCQDFPTKKEALEAARSLQAEADAAGGAK